MSHFKHYAATQSVLLFIASMTFPCLWTTGSSGIASSAQPPSAKIQAATLFCLSGDVPKTSCFTTADLAQLPRTTITINERDGTHTTYSGVLLREVLQRAGVLQGEQLRGENLARYLVVEAADGYAVVFGLPEFDPAFGNRLVLLADRQNGQALSPDEAPLRLVIPADQRRARWVRKIARMRIMQAPH